MGFITNWEDDLIHPEKWKELYSEMPDEYKKIVDDNEDCIGIGKNEKMGWFIGMSGQGPVIVWQEKENK